MPSITRDYYILRKLRMEDFKPKSSVEVGLNRDALLEAATYRAGYEEEGQQE